MYAHGICAVHICGDIDVLNFNTNSIDKNSKVCMSFLSTPLIHSHSGHVIVQTVVFYGEIKLIDFLSFNQSFATNQTC